MLPEHVEMLKDVFAEVEQQIIVINATLQYALNDDLPVQIKYFHRYDKHAMKVKVFLEHTFSKTPNLNQDP